VKEEKLIISTRLYSTNAVAIADVLDHAHYLGLDAYVNYHWFRRRIAIEAHGPEQIGALIHDTALLNRLGALGRHR
jgi:hypothetical protein